MWDAPVYNSTDNTLSFTVRTSSSSQTFSVSCAARCSRVATFETPQLPMLSLIKRSSAIVGASAGLRASPWGGIRIPSRAGAG